ncbi:MAG: thermopsin family protease [Candidatus Micrarchaeia archaeon]
MGYNYGKLAIDVALLIFILIVGFARSASVTYSLYKGEYAYYPINISTNSYVSVVYNLTNYGNLLILNKTNFDMFENAEHYVPIYNLTISGKNIKNFDLSQGNYFIVLYAKNTSIKYSFNLGIMLSKPNIIKISNGKTYVIPINIENYSNVSIEIVSTSALNINFLGNDNNYSPFYFLTIYQYENRGVYNITITTQNPTLLAYSLSEKPSLVNPLELANSSKHISLGLASYGIAYSRNSIVPYQLNTTFVEGDAIIRDIKAYSYYPETSGFTNITYGASLQLNAVMNALINGRQNVFWLQNVIEFNTSSNEYSFCYNIWNLTSENGSIYPGFIIGKGSLIMNSSQEGGKQSIYGYCTNPFKYKLPEDFSPIIMLQNTNSNTYIIFGYRSSNKIYAYDNLSFNKRVYNASLLVTPFYQTPNLQFYDLEFVFGGESNGEAAVFQNINASIWLFYRYKNNILEVPSAYTFGLDTLESAQNITASDLNGSGVLIHNGMQNRSKIFEFQKITASGNSTKTISNISNLKVVTINSQNETTTPSNLSSTYTYTIEAIYPPNYSGSRFLNPDLVAKYKFYIEFSICSLLIIYIVIYILKKSKRKSIRYKK